MCPRQWSLSAAVVTHIASGIHRPDDQYVVNNSYCKDDLRAATGGGICTCPDGQTYLVGDNSDNCGSLACEGGTSALCSPNVPWQFASMQVICGNVPLGDNQQCRHYEHPTSFYEPPPGLAYVLGLATFMALSVVLAFNAVSLVWWCTCRVDFSKLCAVAVTRTRMLKDWIQQAIAVPTDNHSSRVTLLVTQRRMHRARIFFQVGNIVFVLFAALNLFNWLALGYIAESAGGGISISSIDTLADGQAFPLAFVVLPVSVMAWFPKLITPRSLDCLNGFMTILWVLKLAFVINDGWWFYQTWILFSRFMQGIVCGNFRLTACLHIIISIAQTYMYEQMKTPVVFSVSNLHNRIGEAILASCAVSLYFMVDVSLRSEAAASYNASESKNQAAQGLRLLSALCDAVAQLDSEWMILDPSPTLAQLLMIQDGQRALQGRSFMSFLSDENDQARIENYTSNALKLADFPCKELASSLHIHLRDSNSINLEVELFVVSFRDLDDSIRHLIGICESTISRGLAAPAAPAAGLAELADSADRLAEPAASVDRLAELPASAAVLAELAGWAEQTADMADHAHVHPLAHPATLAVDSQMNALGVQHSDANTNVSDMSTDSGESMAADPMSKPEVVLDGRKNVISTNPRFDLLFGQQLEVGSSFSAQCFSSEEELHFDRFFERAVNVAVNAPFEELPWRLQIDSVPMNLMSGTRKAHPSIVSLTLTFNHARSMPSLPDDEENSGSFDLDAYRVILSVMAWERVKARTSTSRRHRSSPQRGSGQQLSEHGTRRELSMEALGIRSGTTRLTL